MNLNSGMDQSHPSLSRRGLAQSILVGIGFCAFFYYFLWNQARFSLEPDWSHSFLVPVISLFYIYENRDTIFKHRVKTNWLGFPVLLVGIGVYFFFTLGPTWNHTLQGAGMIISLLGLVMLMVGWRMWMALLFPMLYLIVGIRMPPRILQMFTPTLQVWASKGSYVLLNILGYETEISGTVLTVTHNGDLIPLNVAEACSGMRTIVSFLALGIAIAFLTLRKPWQRVALIAMGIPVAIFINILRVATLGVLSTIDEDLAKGQTHIYVGLLWLIPAFFLYIGIAWVLQHLFVEPPVKATPKTRTQRQPFLTAGGERSWLGPAVVTIGLVAGLGAFTWAQDYLGVFLHKESVPLRRAFRELPTRVGDWRAFGPDAALSPEIVHELGTSDYLSRSYALNGNPSTGVMELHLAYYTGGIDAVPHIPDRCLVGGGLTKAPTSSHVPVVLDRTLWWIDPEYSATDGEGPVYYMAQAGGGNRLVARMPRLGSSGMTINASEYWAQDTPDQKIAAGYLFIANGSATSSPEGVRLMAYDPEATHAYYCKIQLTLQLPDGQADRQRLGTIAGEFLSELLPDLMLCLPDWIEVKTGQWPPPVEEDASDRDASLPHMNESHEKTAMAIGDGGTNLRRA